MGLFDIHGNPLAIGGASGGFDTTITTVTEPIELYSQYGWTHGKYIANGVIKDNSARSISDQIKCDSTDTITFTTAKNNLKEGVGFWCFDANGTSLGYVGLSEYSTEGGVYEYSPLAGTAYAVISTLTPYITSGDITAVIYRPVNHIDFHDSAFRRMTPLAKREEVDAHLDVLDALLYNYTKWNGKSLITDGNSLVASTRWGETLAEFLGMNLTNIGRSGYAIVYPTDTMDIIKNRVNTDYPETADLVILQGDTNRGMDGEPSDQMDGDNPKTTWMAQMNYHIRCIKAKYHNVVVVLMPDSVRYQNDADQYLTDMNRNSYNAMKALAEYNRLAFFDFDHSTPFNPLHLDNWYSRYAQEHEQYGVAQDYVHPAGGYRLAKGYALAHWVAGLVFDPDAPNTAATNWQDTV